MVDGRWQSASRPIGADNSVQNMERKPMYGETSSELFVLFVTFILFLYIVEAVFCIFEGRGRKKAYSHPKFNYIYMDYEAMYSTVHNILLCSCF